VTPILDDNARAIVKPRLTVVPCTLSEAHAFVKQHHRHHKPSPGGLFAISVSDGETIRGVATVGRPVARNADDGWTAEVTRVATDGCPNACSALYGAAWRAAKAMGFKRMITYTLDSEPGTSLMAAGWKAIGQVGGGSWSRENRPRVDKHPLQKKIRWEANSGAADS
jgi:hypothetical protein